MIRRGIWLAGIIGVLILLAAPCAYASGGVVVVQELKLVAPSLEYAGSHYYIVFDLYQNPADLSSLYFKLNTGYVSSGGGTCSGYVDSNLNIHDLCLLLNGTNYKVSLDYYLNPLDGNGLYWRLSMVEPLIGTISEVTGVDICIDFSEIDPSISNGLIQCLNGCLSSDIYNYTNCMFDCFSSSGIELPGLFSVSVTLNNPTSSDVYFTIPAGVIFVPDNTGIQPMLAINSLTAILKPGDTTVCVPTFCIDSSGGVPGDSDVFRSQIAPSHGCLAEIVSMVQDKELSMSQKSRLQDIIWNCQDEGIITEEDRAFLQGL